MSTLIFPLSIHPIRFAPGTNIPHTLHRVRPASHTPALLLDDQASHRAGKKTASHLSELVGRSTGDLGDPQGSQLGLEFIELGEEVGLVPAGSRWLFVKVDKKGRS